MWSSPNELLTVAAREIGTIERGFTNDVKYSRWWGAAAPWCMMFVNWCLDQCDLDVVGRQAGAPKGTAFTPTAANWFQTRVRWHGPAAMPQPGWLVFYDFPGDGVNRISHVGIVERDLDGGFIQTIEGNTSDGAGGSQTDGGGVWRRTRRVSDAVVGYGATDFEEMSMAAREDILAAIRDARGARNLDITQATEKVEKTFNQVNVKAGEVVNAINALPAKVAEAVVAVLPPGQAGGVTEAQVEAAVARVLGRTFLGVTNEPT